MQPAPATARSGLLGWLLVAITAIALLVAIWLTLNFVSRDTLDPLPSVSTSAI